MSRRAWRLRIRRPKRLGRPSPGAWSQVMSLGKMFFSTPLYPGVLRVPANLILGDTLWWTMVPSREGWNYFQPRRATKPGISSGCIYNLSRCRLNPNLLLVVVCNDGTLMNFLHTLLSQVLRGYFSRLFVCLHCSIQDVKNPLAWRTVEFRTIKSLHLRSSIIITLSKADCTSQTKVT